MGWRRAIDANQIEVRRIMRLRRDLGINYAGIGVVLDLLARIETLEAQLSGSK